MKFKTIALATAFALTSTFAFAQAGTGSGATVPEKSGAAVNGGGATGPTGRSSGDAAMQNNMGTTGTSNAPDASKSGANTAASVGAKGDATEPGKVQEGKTR